MKLQRSENDAVVDMLEKSSLWSGLDRQDFKAIVKISKQQEVSGRRTLLSRKEKKRESDSPMSSTAQ